MLTPMRLLRIPEPFDHQDFIFEPKLDGFRALAHVHGHRCELVSRNGHTFKHWPQLAEESRTRCARIRASSMADLLPRVRPAAPIPEGAAALLRIRVLRIDGEDLTLLPLLARKRRLLRIMPTIETRLISRSHRATRVRSVPSRM
jgi:bifunctional non-homologous end joining protein LigD